MSRSSAETEREAALADARENGELLALARRAARAGTFDLDIRSGTVRYCPRSLEMLGHPPDRPPVLTAAEWARHIFPGDAERVLAEGRGARDKGADLFTEYRIVRTDGRITWVRALGRTLCDEREEAVRCVGFNFDVTEEKKAEAEFRRMHAELAQASRANAMATMAETLAHELNQPLAAISNYLSGIRAMLARPADRPEAVGEALGLALDASHRASDIIRNLRALTRRDRGGAGETRLDVTIRKALDLVLLEAEQAGIGVRSELAADLNVCVDDLQVQQVVYNLIRNAVEAIDGCLSRNISIASARKGDCAYVRIEDSGRGIPEAARARMFDPFVTTKANGVGIGLAISRTIVEAHGGQLWAEPLETGTAFCLMLPLAREAA